MARCETINFKDFMENDLEGRADPKKYALAGAGSLALLLPKTTFAAAANSTFSNVHGTVMNVFDSAVVLVIIFAGATWGLGHRSKAIEILIGVCCGYILARHAVDIRDYLKAI